MRKVAFWKVIGKIELGSVSPQDFQDTDFQSYTGC